MKQVVKLIGTLIFFLVALLVARFIYSPPVELRWLWVATVVGLCALAAFAIYRHGRRNGPS